MHTEHGGSGTQLRLPHLRERFWTGMPGIVRTMTAVASAVAAGGGEQKHVNAFGRVLGERAADAERLIVWVREHGHQLRSRHRGVDFMCGTASTHS